MTIGSSRYALQINQQVKMPAEQAALILDGNVVAADSALFISANCIALPLDNLPHQLSWHRLID